MEGRAGRAMRNLVVGILANWSEMYSDDVDIAGPVEASIRNQTPFQIDSCCALESASAGYQMCAATEARPLAVTRFEHVRLSVYERTPGVGAGYRVDPQLRVGFDFGSVELVPLRRLH